MPLFLTSSFYLIDSPSVVIQTTYTSELTINSSKRAQNCIVPYYYYNTIQVNVAEGGFYILGTVAEIATGDHIYEEKFNPFNPSMNEMKTVNRISDCVNEFHHVSHFDNQKTYIIVVSSSYPNSTGTYSVIVSGANKVNLTYIG